MLRCNFSIAVRWHDRRRTARNRLIFSLSLSWTLIIKRIHLTAILIIGRRHKGTLGVYIRAYSVPTDRIKDRLSAYRTNLRRVAVPIRLAPMRNHRRHPAIPPSRYMSLLSTVKPGADRASADGKSCFVGNNGSPSVIT